MKMQAELCDGSNANPESWPHQRGKSQKRVWPQAALVKARQGESGATRRMEQTQQGFRNGSKLLMQHAPEPQESGSSQTGIVEWDPPESAKDCL